jgi:hypothetical protein
MGAKRILSTLAIGAMLAASLPAQALDRLFPPNIKRGTLSNVDFPSVSLNGSQRKLAPGAWIRNENNMIDMPVTLRGREFTVNYTENPQGDIDRVWILTPAEASVPLPKQPQQ